MLDSSFLVAVRHEGDVHHRAALQVWDRLLEGAWGTILLPEYVVLEVTSVILKRRGLEPAVRAAEDLVLAEEFEFVPCSELFFDAHASFCAQRDTQLSIVDHAIVGLFRRSGASHVATFDKGFRKIRGLKTVP